MAVKISMAEAVKTAASRIAGECEFHLPSYNFYESFPELKDQKLSCGYTVRELWVAVAEVYRKFSSHVWMFKAFREAMSLPCPFVIITDVRKAEEFSFWKGYGALMVNILGPGERCVTASVDDDSGWDLTVENKRDPKGGTSGASDAAIEIWNKGILPKLEEKYAEQTAGGSGES